MRPFVNLLLTTAAIVSASLGVARDACGTAPMPTSMPPTLLYCDRSPGTIGPYIVWTRNAAGAINENVTDVSDANDFAARLADPTWERVVVLARYAPGAPSYAEALRAYADRTHKPVDLWFWHDHGTPPAANTVVAATMGYVLWRNGFSTIYYSTVTDPPLTATGYLFPGFNNVPIKAPETVIEVPAAETQPMFPMVFLLAIVGDPCRNACLEAWIARLNTCNQDHQEYVDGCNTLYGPRGVADPPAWNGCMNQADQNLVACRNVALQHWVLCNKLCATTQPSPH